MLRRRFWRSVAISLLPECVKGPLRKRLHGFRQPATPFRIASGPDNRVTIDDRIELRITEDFKSSLSYQCVDNADAIDEMRAFLALAQSKCVLFDVGAYTGLFSLFFCALGDEKRAVAFEPSPIMAPALESLREMNSLETRMSIEKMAIGQSSGRASLFLENTGFVQILASGSTVESVSVPITTLDESCERLGVTPDLLKIDVEGFELEALLGAEKLLSRNRPTILLELHLNYLESRGINPRSVTDYLQEHSYKLYSCHALPTSAKSIYDSIKPVVRFLAK